MVGRFIREYILCCTNNLSKKKQGIYHHFPIPFVLGKEFPWTLEDLPTTQKWWYYLFIKMYVLIPSKKTINEQEATNLFIKHVWVHFGIRKNIVSNNDMIFLRTIFTTMWEKMDTKLKRSITFHPQIVGKTNVVNKTLV